MNFISWYGADPFYMEDEKIYEKIDKFINQMHVHEKYVNKK